MQPGAHQKWPRHFKCLLGKEINTIHTWKQNWFLIFSVFHPHLVLSLPAKLAQWLWPGASVFNSPKFLSSSHSVYRHTNNAHTHTHTHAHTHTHTHISLYNRKPIGTFSCLYTLLILKKWPCAQLSFAYTLSSINKYTNDFFNEVNFLLKAKITKSIVDFLLNQK